MLKILPILAVALISGAYHICAKNSPPELNPFASLSVSYIMAAIGALAMFFLTREKGESLIREYSRVNYTSFVLGLCVMGIDAGNNFMYRMGWNINTGYVITSMGITVFLLIIGALLYNEPAGWPKIAGVALCFLGLYLIRR